MTRTLLAAVAALAIGGVAYKAAQVQPLGDAKPADAPVDFTFSLQCSAVEGLKRIALPYEEARKSFELHESDGIIAAYDGVLIYYNHGLPDDHWFDAEFGTHVTKVTPNEIQVGSYMDDEGGFFDRRTGYGEIIFYKAPHSSAVNKMWVFQCEPSKPKF
jgi:hypothetical protein